MITNVITQYYGMMHVMARVSTPDASLGSGVSGGSPSSGPLGSWDLRVHSLECTLILILTRARGREKVG